MAGKQDFSHSLLDELRLAARRRLPQMFKDIAKDSKQYPILARIAQAAEPALWAEDPTRALLVVMRSAVKAIPEKTAWNCPAGRTWQHLARLLYFGSEVDGSLHSYNDFHATALEYAGSAWSKRAFGRLTRRVRDQLATVLTGIEQQASDTASIAQMTDIIGGGPAAASDQSGLGRQLPAEVIALLAAHVAAARNLPYWPYDTSLPSMTDIYVAQPIGVAGDFRAVHASLSDALTAHEHVVVIGEAGAGKSTLALQTAAALARDLLDGSDPMKQTDIPLYVPARLMTEGTTFHQALISGLQGYLAAYLTDGLNESLFAHDLPQGARWLIFIDGLDEIIDPVARKQLLAQIAHHTSSGRYRFVLTSRRQDEELPGMQSPIGRYELLPFTLMQLALFARQWFAARSSPDPERDAALFLRELNGHELLSPPSDIGHDRRPFSARDLFSVRNPLAATIAALTFLHGGGRLPATVSALYEAFVTYLLYQRQAQVQPHKHLRQLLAVGGSRGRRLADHLYDNRRELCSHLAWRLLEGDRRDLTVVVREWIGQTFGEMLQIPQLTECLESVLIDTGLITRQGACLSFIHRSVAEYLAAPLAGLPGLVEDGPRWQREEMDTGRSLYLHFRILAWARDSDAGTLVESFLDQGSYASYATLCWLVKNGLGLNDKAISRFIWFFKGGYRSIIGTSLDTLELRQHILRGRYIWKTVTERHVVLLLCDIAPRYPQFLERLHAMVDEDIGPEAKIAGLVELWRLGETAFVLPRLKHLAESTDANRRLDLVDFYINIGNKQQAIAVLKWVAGTTAVPEILHRAAGLADGLRKKDIICRWITEALTSAHLDWPNRIELVARLYCLGAEETARTILQRLLSDEPCALRGTAALEALEFSVLTKTTNWARELYREERHRLLDDPHNTWDTRELVYMLDAADFHGAEFQWTMSAKLRKRLEEFDATTRSPGSSSPWINSADTGGTRSSTF